MRLKHQLEPISVYGFCAFLLPTGKINDKLIQKYDSNWDTKYDPNRDITVSLKRDIMIAMSKQEFDKVVR